METTIYYQFKQWYDTKAGFDANGETKIVKKLGNTIALGTMTFPDSKTALDYLQDQIESMNISECEVQEWELVRVIQDVVPNAIGKFTKE